MNRLLKHIALSSVFLVLVLFSVYMVVGFFSDQVTLQAPTKGENFSASTTLRLNVTIPMFANITNVSFWYSADYNATWTFIGANNTFANSTLRNATNYTVSWDTTGIDDARNYVVKALIYENGSIYSNSSLAYNITIDDTAPVILLWGWAPDQTGYFSSTHYRANQTGIRLNFTATDALLELRTCRLQTDFAGTYGTNATILYPNTTSGAITQFNITGNQNYVNLSDGTYKWNVVCNDSVGNSQHNATNFTLVIDTAVPTSVSITVPSTDVTFTNSDTVSCASTDATAGVNSTVITIKGPGADTTTRKTIRATSGTFETGSGKEIGTIGTYTVDCTVKDRAGNSASASSATFVVRHSSSGTSGGGGETTTRTHSLGTLNTGESKIQLITQNNKASFTIANTLHIATLTNVGTNSATLKIESDPITLTINKGEIKKIDFDQNNVYDLAVKLIEIIGTRANLEFKAIAESYTGAAVPYEGAAEEVSEEEIPEEVTPTTKPVSTAIWWIVGIIILIIVIAIIYSATRKKR